MVYFLRNMVNIIKNNDHVAYEKQLNDSYLVSEIMEKGSSTRSVSYLIMISTKRDRTLVCVLPLFVYNGFTMTRHGFCLSHSSGKHSSFKKPTFW